MLNLSLDSILDAVAKAASKQADSAQKEADLFAKIAELAEDAGIRDSIDMLKEDALDLLTDIIDRLDLDDDDEPEAPKAEETPKTFSHTFTFDPNSEEFRNQFGDIMKFLNPDNKPGVGGFGGFSL